MGWFRTHAAITDFSKSDTNSAVLYSCWRL